jgi:hypothetical protein
MNEQEQFLKDLESDQDGKSVDILEQNLIPDLEKGEDDKKEDDKGGDSEGDDEIQGKNRREKRLLKRLEAERNSSMFLAGKLEAREEARVAISESADYLKDVERIYGTDTPEAQLATDLLKKAIVGARDDAENRAYARIMDERKKEAEAERQAASQLDSFIEEIEDTYDVTLNEAQEKSYFTLLQKMSPKDTHGNVTEYADPHAVWEVFQDKLKSRGTDNRAKQLSSRSMVKSGASKETSLQDDSATRFLKESGII